eukprot:GILK01001523.1.p1 GENE.GILK01001523.1~~GILK01001523.1.p1  ORF type:complete len:196 (-),score=32.52 GILK01001523.1:169-756(-)
MDNQTSSHIENQRTVMEGPVPGAVLSKDEILKAVDAGDILITPYDPSAVGWASIDLTLSNEFRFYKPGRAVVSIQEDTDYKSITEKVVLPEGETFLLCPGQACLGITTESVQLAPHLCGLLEGRSRFARLGLFVHITAGFMQPGINNRQVLEIFNASNNTVALVPGTRVCQFVFLRMHGQSKYSGSFSAQLGTNW